jgi:hypothetical protein
VVRSFNSFSQASLENAESRVWVGFHFRTSCMHGITQGNQVARWVLDNFLQPRQ